MGDLLSSTQLCAIINHGVLRFPYNTLRDYMTINYILLLLIHNMKGPNFILTKNKNNFIDDTKKCNFLTDPVCTQSGRYQFSHSDDIISYL